MEKSSIIMGLALITLLCGLAFGFYQLWSVERAKRRHSHSALGDRQRATAGAGSPPSGSNR